MDLNRMYYGDCIKILRKIIIPESIDFIYADPPYDVEDPKYAKFTKRWVQGAKDALRPNGSMAVSCLYTNLAECMTAITASGLKIQNLLVWQKSATLPIPHKKVFTQTAQFIIWATKGEDWTYDAEALREINTERDMHGNPRKMRDIWKIPAVAGAQRMKTRQGIILHPDQKPEELLLRLITGLTKFGDLVLDPFVGTGTTAYIARKLHRQWIGIEKHRPYFRLAKKRMKLDKRNKR